MRVIRLAPEIFNDVAADTGMGSQARDMAYAVLVDGRAQVDVAVEYGLSKQRVNLAVATIRRAYLKSPAFDGSSICIELELPESLAVELGGVAEKIRLCADAEWRRVVIEELRSAVRKANLALSKG